MQHVGIYTYILYNYMANALHCSVIHAILWLIVFWMVCIVASWLWVILS